jgi:N-acetylglucosamine-6-phosphate deacetylase
MLIKNIYVYDEYGMKHLKHALITEEGSKIILDLHDDISSYEAKKIKIIDCNGTYFLMPGMLDAHVHGHGGVDFADIGDETSEEELQTIVRELGKTGLSYALATLVSMPIESIKKSLIKISDFMKKNEHTPTPGCTRIVGVHLEGPFISSSCKGAHNEDVLQHSISMEQFREIIDVAPDIKQWKITLSPDLPGAEEFIKQTKSIEQEGIFVKVFIGHTNPTDKETITRAIAAGAVGFTHLGNACQEQCSRDARELSASDATSHVVQWVLENPDLCPPGIELITDGVHLSSSFVTLINNRLKHKTMLVTDALGPSGCKDGLYKLGALDIRKEHNSFYLADEEGQIKMKMGTLTSGQTGAVKSLAGSAAPLSHCVQQFFETMDDESIESRMDSVYSGIIYNPRVSSLSEDAIKNLQDDTNFVLLNDKGQLMLSSCNAKITEHQQLQWPIDSLLAYGILSPTPTKDGGHRSLHVPTI